MSEYTSTLHSSRGGSVRDPASYGTAADVVTHPNVPRVYSTGGSSITITKGFYIYPKAGEVVFFYEDSNGTKKITKSKEQVSDPFRAGNDLVGTATGKVAKATTDHFIEVEWVNSFVDHKLFKADEKINEPRIGWVAASKVDWQNVYQSPDEKNVESSNNPTVTDSPNLPAASGGIDTTTLGFIAVATALVVSKKKRKK